MSFLRFSFIYLLIIIAVIALISFLIIRAYNKRLEKIAKGELRDTHSNIPEPRTTIGVTYKTILMGVLIFTFFTVSFVSGRLSSLQNTINDLKSSQHMIDMDICELREDLRQSESLVSSFSGEFVGYDLEKKTADLLFHVSLKQYSDDTVISLVLNDHTVTLTKTTPGTFSGKITANLFEKCSDLKICIKEGNLTKVESSDFLLFPFVDALPMPIFELNTNYSEHFGKSKFDGWYRIVFDRPELMQKIQTVTISYMVDGSAIKTFDATSQVKELVQIPWDQDIATDNFQEYVGLRVEVVTEHFIIDTLRTIVEHPNVHSNFSYENIYDSDGTLLWNNEKYD